MSELIPFWLLDKNVVRNGLNALARLALDQPLAAADLPPLEVLRAAREKRIHGVISPELFNILQRRIHQPVVQAALTSLDVFRPARYFKRWARRLCAEGFTGEDAKVIALATFGIDEAATRISVDAVVTGDVHMIRNYTHRLGVIRRRLTAMTAQLSQPYRSASLPIIMTAVDATERLAALPEQTDL